jgi:hypothetical protein
MFQHSLPTSSCLCPGLEGKAPGFVPSSALAATPEYYSIGKSDSISASPSPVAKVASRERSGGQKLP